MEVPVVDHRPKISHGEYLAVQKIGGDHVRVLQFLPRQKVLIEKLKFNSDSAVGKPYGLFEVIAGQCHELEVSKLIDEQTEQEVVNPLPSTSRGTESLIQKDSVEGSTDEQQVSTAPVAPSSLRLAPDESRQVLTQDEVLQLKKDGASASSLVARLVEGNRAFANRTTHSQGKYIKRKANKHSDRVLIQKPTIRLLVNSYYTKDADRIGCLRIDQLGLLLQLAGIHHGKRVVVFDQVLGLATSSVLERLGGNGACVHIHKGAIAQSIPGVHSMNYSEKTLNAFFPVRIACLLAGRQLAHEGSKKEPAKEAPPGDVDDRDEAMNVDVVVDQTEAEALVRRNERMEREKRGLEVIQRGTDSLIIATRTVDPVSILEVLYPTLRPSATVAIFCPQPKFLIDAYEWLMKNMAIHMQLTDQMFRVHQVLPGRTHPLMSQQVVGGGVLSAIKTIPPPPLTL